MQIKKIHIQNFKSLVDFELDSPKQFCAFVGPNASGKSNIFEALEFVNYIITFSIAAPNFFGGKSDVLSFNSLNNPNSQIFSVVFKDDVEIAMTGDFGDSLGDRFATVGGWYSADAIVITEIINPDKRKKFIARRKESGLQYADDYEVFCDNFSRIFVGKSELLRINSKSPKLKTDASNLAQILWQIFQDENKKEDFIDWLRILIPEFEDIVVKQSNIDDSHEFFVKEKGSEKPFPRRLLSDGTKNILALMAAVYQSSEPQFLCIEEPENGLHPEAIQLLVDFFRDKCENEGHHIWLNTHSPTLVRSMKIDEIVLVNKIDGQTKARTVLNANELDIKTDEAWLTNALGGGVSWSK